MIFIKLFYSSIAFDKFIIPCFINKGGKSSFELIRRLRALSIEAIRIPFVSWRHIKSLVLFWLHILLVQKSIISKLAADYYLAIRRKNYLNQNLFLILLHSLGTGIKNPEKASYSVPALLRFYLWMILIILIKSCFPAE